MKDIIVILCNKKTYDINIGNGGKVWIKDIIQLASK